MLRQRDRILAMRALSDTTTAVVLPLTDVIIEQGKATVTLGVTVPGRDACQAQLYYRTVIDPSSRITFGGTASTTANISCGRKGFARGIFISIDPRRERLCCGSRSAGWEKARSGRASKRGDQITLRSL